MLELARKAGDVNLQAAAEKNHTLRKRTQGRCRVEVYFRMTSGMRPDHVRQGLFFDNLTQFSKGSRV